MKVTSIIAVIAAALILGFSLTLIIGRPPAAAPDPRLQADWNALNAQDQAHNDELRRKNDELRKEIQQLQVEAMGGHTTAAHTPSR